MRHPASPLLWRPAALTLLCLLIPTTACAQSQSEIDALRKEIAEIKATQAEMQKQLDEIKAMLRPKSPIVDVRPGVTVPTSGAPARGAADARVVLVEYSDFECPFCGRFKRDALARIEAEYITPGKVRHVFLSFPLESIHQNALKAHEAALCANEQGKFWPMYDRLFTNQRALAPADLVTHAQAIGLEAPAFKACLEKGTMTARVRAEMELGQRLGVQGTPALLIGTPGPNGEVAVKKAISGAHPFEVFKEALDAVLAGK
jgi:protein-disulfide isomerase